MATKYPSRPDRKQIVFNTNLDLLATRSGTTPVVATAEANEITLFWFAKDGWKSWIREHCALDTPTIAPASIAQLNWSQQVAVAAGEGFVALVYKRLLSKDDSPKIFVEILEWHEAEETLVPVREEPFAVPFDDLNLAAPGFDLWAEWRKGHLSIVLQASPTTKIHRPFGGVDITVVGSPKLIFLTVPIADVGNLQLDDAHSWTSIELDDGGYDFDVVREGEQLYCVHRRKAETISVELSQVDGQGFLIINPDEPDLGNVTAEQVYTPISLVELDLTSGNPIVVADNIGIGEHPQIHRANPFVITADLTYWFITGDLAHHPALIQPGSLVTTKKLIMQAGTKWVRSGLYDLDLRFFPFHLFSLSSSQYLVSLDEFKCGLATLLRTEQVLLLHFEERLRKKDKSLVFLKAGVVAEYFSVSIFSDPPALTAHPEGLSIWDINHQSIAFPGDTPLFDEGENAQFRPDKDTNTRYKHHDGFSVQGYEPERTINTLGGALVGKKGNPAVFHSYVDMGDCGVRVIFEPGKVVLGPRTPGPFKQLKPEFIEANNDPGTRWVTLHAADFRPTHQPGYPAPQFVFDVPGPRALGSRLHAVLDTLERVITVGVHGHLASAPVVNPLVIGEPEASCTDMNPGSECIERVMLGLVPPSSPFTAETPFHVEFKFSPGYLFAKVVYSFIATTGANDNNFTFQWTFTDLGHNPPPAVTVANRSITHKFARGGDFRVVVDVTDATGRTTQCQATVTVIESVWALLWSFQDQINLPADPTQPGARIGSFSLDVSKYRLEYATTAAFKPQLLTINSNSEHKTAFRFQSGPDGGQGIVPLQMTLKLTSSQAVPAGSMGWLATLITINTLAASLSYERAFTPCVLTSDQRSLEPATNISGKKEEVIEQELPNQFSTIVAAGLACKPVGVGSVKVGNVDVKVSLSSLSQASVWIVVGLLITLGLGPTLAGAIFVAMAISGAIAISVTVAVLVSLLIAAGLTALLIYVWAPQWISTYVSAEVKKNLNDRAPTIASNMDKFGLSQYAGEGLADTIAREAIKEAIAQGAHIDPPAGDGLDRVRKDLFEMVVVTDKECRVLMRC